MIKQTNTKTEGTCNPSSLGLRHTDGEYKANLDYTEDTPVRQRYDRQADR